MPVPNDPQRDADARPAGPPPALRGEPGALGEVDALASGAGLGKYRILERMHATRQATLYKARDVMLDRLAAIKQLAPDLIDDPRACGRFRKEAYTLAQISHDARYVVGVYELIEQPRGLFLVMEYVPGYSLETLITKRQLSLQGTLELLARSCLGLRSVHAAGFIHRDLSPRHIITDPRCRPRIADFSMAMNAGAEPDYTVGSPAYTAPEIYLEQPFDDCIDIYSLGVIAYEMLIGRTEFSRLTQRTIGAIDDPIRWLAWHADPDSSWPAASELNPRVPPMLSEIVARMMARQRDERFSNIDDVLTMLVRHFSRAPRRVLTGVPAGLVAGTLPGAAVAPMPAAAVGEPRRIVDVTILPPAAGVFEPGLPPLAPAAAAAPAAPIAAPPAAVPSAAPSFAPPPMFEPMAPTIAPATIPPIDQPRVAASSPAPSPAVTPSVAPPAASLFAGAVRAEVAGGYSPFGGGMAVRPPEAPLASSGLVSGLIAGVAPAGSARQTHTVSVSASTGPAAIPGRGAAEVPLPWGRGEEQRRPVVRSVPPLRQREAHELALARQRAARRRAVRRACVTLIGMAAMCGGGWSLHRVFPALLSDSAKQIAARVESAKAAYRAGDYSKAVTILTEVEAARVSGVIASERRAEGIRWLSLAEARAALAERNLDLAEMKLKEAVSRGIEYSLVGDLQRQLIKEQSLAQLRRGYGRNGENGKDKPQPTIPDLEPPAGSEPLAIKPKRPSAPLGADEEQDGSERSYQRLMEEMRDAMGRKDYDAAYQAIERIRSLRHTPETEDLYVEIAQRRDGMLAAAQGDSAMLRGNYDEAVEQYRVAVKKTHSAELEQKLKRAQAMGLILEARTSAELGDIDEAVKKLRSAAWRDPTSDANRELAALQPAIRAVDAVHRGERAMQLGDYSEAVRRFESALKDIPAALRDDLYQKLNEARTKAASPR